MSSSGIDSSKLSGRMGVWRERINLLVCAALEKIAPQPVPEKEFWINFKKHGDQSGTGTAAEATGGSGSSSGRPGRPAVRPELPVEQLESPVIGDSAGATGRRPGRRDSPVIGDSVSDSVRPLGPVHRPGAPMLRDLSGQAGCGDSRLPEPPGCPVDWHLREGCVRL